VTPLDLPELLVAEAVVRERLRLGFVREADRLLRDVLREVRQRLLLGGETLTARDRARLQALYVDVAQTLGVGVRRLQADLLASFGEFAALESDIANALTQRAGALAGLTLELPRLASVDLLAAVLMDVEGASLTTWFPKLATDTAFRIQREVAKGVLQGETIPQLARRLLATDGLGGVVTKAARQQATTLVRTATTAISAEAQRLTFAAQDTAVTGSYQYVATLDERTTVICATLDGRIFRYDDPEARQPPQHPNCRSTIVPVIDWAGLGVDPKDVPPLVRASVDGPVTWTTYDAWLRLQPPARQNRVLGVGLAQLYRDGKLSLADLVTTQGTPLTLRAARTALGL
jgi:SPP1 gp7 family putative phage head morphogenesis protein